MCGGLLRSGLASTPDWLTVRLKIPEPATTGAVTPKSKTLSGIAAPDVTLPLPPTDPVVDVAVSARHMVCLDMGCLALSFAVHLFFFCARLYWLI